MGPGAAEIQPAVRVQEYQEPGLPPEGNHQVCPMRTGLYRGVPEKPGVLLLPGPGLDRLGSREMSGRKAERSRVRRSRLRDGVPVPERPGDLPG